MSIRAVAFRSSYSVLLPPLASKITLNNATDSVSSRELDTRPRWVINQLLVSRYVSLAIESGDGKQYYRPHGSMHSTSTWSSHSERSSGLPSTRRRWTLQRLQRIWLLVPVLLLMGKQRRCVWYPRQRFWQQRKAALVASQFVRVVHACRGTGTHAVPRNYRKTSAVA